MSILPPLVPGRSDARDFRIPISSFFILSNPRSGSSLLRLMLNSHPHICVPPECGFVQWLYAKNIKSVDAFVAALSQCKKIETWNLDMEALTRHLRALQPGSYADMCESVYRFYAADKDLKIWGDKNNYYIHHIDILEAVFPSTKYVHLVRDGRDVACSYKNVMKMRVNSIYAPRLDTDLDKIAKEWTRNVLTVQSHLDRAADDRHITLRYEDLVRDPAGTLRSLCAFLRVDYRKEMLNYYSEDNHDEPAALMEWKLKTKQPVDESSSKRFVTELSAQEIQEFNRTAGDALCRFGYLDRQAVNKE